MALVVALAMYIGALIPLWDPGGSGINMFLTVTVSLFESPWQVMSERSNLTQ